VATGKTCANVLCCASGLRKLVLGNLSYALGEFYRGIYKAAQVKELQKFVPLLQNSDVVKFVSRLSLLLSLIKCLRRTSVLRVLLVTGLRSLTV